MGNCLPIWGLAARNPDGTLEIMATGALSLALVIAVTNLP
jgi:hypothetical protein